MFNNISLFLIVYDPCWVMCERKRVDNGAARLHNEVFRAALVSMWAAAKVERGYMC